MDVPFTFADQSESQNGLLAAEDSQGLSRIIAEAWAPAAQILTSPHLALRRFISFASVVTIRAPVAANG